jgi:hypothetical protein
MSMALRNKMEVVAKERMSWMLFRSNDEYFLSILCGTVGIYEMAISLNKVETQSFKNEGEQFISRLAQSVRNAPGSFTNRQCAKAKSAIEAWSSSHAS